MKAPFLRIVAGTALAGSVTTASAAEPSARPAPETDPAPERMPLTITHANKQVRDKRRDAWWAAEVITHYWRARLNMHSAASRAQQWELLEGQNHPLLDEDGRWKLVTRWREAMVAQLLTPAHNVAAVAWKKTELNSRHISRMEVDPGKVARAIEADEAFLASHPMRRPNPEATARRRAFKEAMRRRIREVAASRKISDEDIKPVLKLKHHEIARFSEVHGVSIGWLLEGAGQVFKSGAKLADHGMEVQP